jgi:hypothetical protein
MHCGNMVIIGYTKWWSEHWRLSNCTVR